MRYADTNPHVLWPGNGTGDKWVQIANTTTASVAFRIFNTPDVPADTAINFTAVDQDNAAVYGDSIPPNKTWLLCCDARYPIIVYNGTSSAINWSLRA